MPDVDIIRIKTRLKNEFTEYINMDDYLDKIDTNDYKNAFFSRSYGASALSQITGIEADEAGNAVTDGFDDFGLDVIYNDRIGKRLILVQSKWSESGNSTISKGDLLKFFEGIEKLMELDFGGFNLKIQNKQEEMTEAIINFEYKILIVLAFTSNQSISPDCQKALSNFIRTKNDGIEDVFDSQIINKSTTYSHMSNIGANNKINIDNVVLNNWGPIEVDEKILGYYGVIAGELLASWYETFGNKLLDKNIRFFKGDTDVNKGIISTVENEPQNFLLYNNGIKVIADTIKRAPHSSNRNSILLKLVGASIVNGAQTTGSIYDLFNKDSKLLQNVKIIVQFIETKDLAIDMDKKITKLSNTQNKVEYKDFATQDPEQERLKKDLSMDNKTYLYKGESSTNNDICSCTIDEATVALGCYSDDISVSSTIKKSYGSIFENTTKPPYKIIFNSSTNAYMLWNCVLILRNVEIIEKEYQRKNSGTKRLISIHGNRFILHMILSQLKADSSIPTTRYLEDNELEDFQLTSIYKKIVERIFEIKEASFLDAYPANIFKNNAKVKVIKESI